MSVGAPISRPGRAVGAPEASRPLWGRDVRSSQADARTARGIPLAPIQVAITPVGAGDTYAGYRRQNAEKLL